MPKLSLVAPETSFALDAHLVLSKGDHLIGHEYLLSADPVLCGHRIDVLQASQFKVDITFDCQGGMGEVAQATPMYADNPKHRFETVEQWAEHDPEAVEQLILPVQSDWERLLPEENNLFVVSE